MKKYFALVLVCGLTGLASPAAQATDAEAMVRQLQPEAAPLTRSLRRGIVAEGSEKPAQVPQINLQINFEYRSADLTQDGRNVLDALAKALKDKRLADSRFLIVGHTDARGGEEYNQDLSIRRANSVKDYLIKTHSVAEARLTAEGRGLTQLADPTRPDHAVNRRVQIINQSASSATN